MLLKTSILAASLQMAIASDKNSDKNNNFIYYFILKHFLLAKGVFLAPACAAHLHTNVCLCTAPLTLINSTQLIQPRAPINRERESG